jgi:FMN reductase
MFGWPRGGAMSEPLIVGMGGTTRRGSTSEQALAFALTSARRLGVATKIYAGSDLQLPMYDPDPCRISGVARNLIDDLRNADGIILASPCYHGGISGLLKNAIDYAEEMRNDARAYFDGRAIGAIGCGSGYQGPVMVLAQLRQIGHALRGWNVPLGVAVNTAVVAFKDDVCSDVGVVKQIEAMTKQVVEHAKRSRLV